MKYLFLSIISLFAIATSCETNLEDINKDPLKLQDADPVYIFPKAVNQTFGGKNYLESFEFRFGSQYVHVFTTNSEMHVTDQYADFHIKDMYNEMFSEVMLTSIKHINEVIRLTSSGKYKNDTQHSIADIVAVLNFSKMTDCWGDIPYFESGRALEGFSYPKYDKQELIYKDMLKRLKNSIVFLKTADPNAAFPKTDPVYSNDLDKWVRFANSLRLRLAMRMRFVEPSFANPIITECLNEKLIEINVQNFYLRRQDNDAIGLSNPWFEVKKYNSPKMGKLFVDFLNKNKDPRLTVFVKKDTIGGYSGIPNGITNNYMSKYDWENYSSPANTIFEKATSQYMMTASEIFFLRAEAALYSLAPGDANQLYQDGIKISLLQWSIPPSSIDAYIKTNPIATLSGSTEQKFEQICTQMWVSLVPNFIEAWSALRRTGYPYISQRDGVEFDRGATNGYLPKRFKYPTEEYLMNNDNLQVALTAIGQDKIDVPVWWDVKD